MAWVCPLQVLGEEWRKIALDFQEKVHKVAVTILKALFIALGRDATIIDDVRLPLTSIKLKWPWLQLNQMWLMCWLLGAEKKAHSCIC